MSLDGTYLTSVLRRCPLGAKSGPSLTIIIYVRNIFGLATKESSHPSMMATSRATTSASPPTPDIVGTISHVRNGPENEPAPAGGRCGAVGRIASTAVII